MLLLTGLNHHTTPIELRERCYIPSEQLPSLLFRLRQLPCVQEAVVISTCNRLEAYVVTRNAARSAKPVMQAICDYYELSLPTIEPLMYVEQGPRAAEHLMRVAAGLDSMVLGESQILGQVREALSAASIANTAGAHLHRLFEMAVHTGKRAHGETAIGEHTTSVSHAAARLVIEHMPSHHGDVLIVGTGEMGMLAAQALKDRGFHNIHVVNRTYSHALDVAQQIGANAHEWSQLWERLASADAVISTTGAPHLVLYRSDVEQVVGQRNGRRLALVDIAVPRDVDPEINNIPLASVFDIDTLQDVVDENIAHRRAAVPHVETIVQDETEKFVCWQNERSITPVIRELRQEVRAVVQAELNDALNKLGDLDEQKQAVVERMAHRIVNKVLHSPTVSLRAHAANGQGEDYAQVVRELFALVPEVQ